MAEKICEKWFYSVGFSFWLEELFFLIYSFTKSSSHLLYVVLSGKIDYLK